MKAERWERVRALFESARELPASERRAHVIQATRGDTSLAEEVLSLLDHDDHALPEIGDQPGFPDRRPESTTSRVGEQLGRYTIVEKLGEGGMGSVYKAEQLEPVRRTVALKLIRRGADSRQVVTRFEAERQALALMSHPSVAQVFDAGTTDEGQPYFAMEYVAGEPVTEFCDAQRLDVRERLALFIEICAGVQHAHQKGIIHRDLKPSNILVTSVGGKPLPKIIDFGIAKATELRLTEATLCTELGQIIGTPEAMSPEQADLGVEDIDTRTDVYSLGVLLYELLSGRLPFEPAELRAAGFDGMRQMIREVDPPRPSTRLGALGGAAKETATNRRADPRALERALRGDLDWITMKALEKERARRYGSASELAADLRRCLDHEPVLAGPPGASYRLRKFVRRNRAAVATVTLVVMALVAGVIGTSLGLFEAREQTRRANYEASVSEEVVDYMIEVFGAADPDEARGEAVTVEEALDRGSEELFDAEFEMDPEIRARLMEAIGLTYRKLGDYERALPLLEQALNLRQQSMNDRDAIYTLNLVGTILTKLQRYEEATPYYEEALSLAEAAWGLEDPWVASITKNLADAKLRSGDLESARALHERSLAIREQLYGREDVRVAGSLSALGETLIRLEEHDAGLRLLERSLAVRLAEEPGGRSAGWGHFSLAEGLLEAGRPTQAVDHYRRALAIWEEMLGPDHDEVGRCVLGLARATAAAEGFASATPHFERALAIEVGRYGATHPNVAELHDAIAESARGGEEEAAAARHQRAAEAIREAQRLRTEKESP